MSKKLIVVIKKGMVANPTTKEELESYNKGDYTFIDGYVASNKKDSENFMSLTNVLKEAEVFSSVEQASGIIDYLQATNKLNDKKDFEIKVEELIIKTKEL